MKRLILSALALCGAAAQACPVVEIHNVRENTGTLMVVVYADAASYNKKPAFATMVKATGGVATVKACGVEGAEMAVSVFQDLNDDGKMNSNVFGIPEEPWGASGSPSAFSAPVWETTKVAVSTSPIIVKLSK
jgi:uncharacterized protein (DUF2141 family)